MSSLRNAVKRRTHKERGQPASRKKLGLLEKKNDYKERAVDFHRRQDKLRALQKKAAAKNEDEFYLGMTRSEPKKSHAEIVKLKAEDLRYACLRQSIDDKRVDKLKANLHFSQEKQNEHTFFGEVGESKEAPPVPKQTKKRVRRAYAALDAAIAQKAASRRTVAVLDAEKKAMTSKGKKRKVKDAANGQPAVFKWKKQRLK